MNDLIVGLILGVTFSGIAAAAVAAWGYRRFLRLAERTRRAERLAELGQLTGGLAHEIKNPLSTIQLNLQLLREDLPADTVVGSRLHNRLRVVTNEAGRLRDILDGFLRYAGRIELELEEVDLGKLVEEVVDFFLPQAAAARVTLRSSVPPEPLVIRADPKLLKQALLNLMLNATQAMTDGGELIVRVGRQGGNAVLDVLDTGPGLSPEAQQNLFKTYFTTKRGGSGLGLPMTRRIAEEHGGTVSVTSEAGKGSVFSIKLPVAGPNHR